ncbi:MAG: hypothetical protein ABNH53_07635 [Henriciella sp.]|jgi:hypothetical protein
MSWLDETQLRDVAEGRALELTCLRCRYIWTEDPTAILVRIDHRDMMRHHLKRFEMSYASLWKRFGIGINQVFFLALLIFLPGLPSNLERAILVVGFLAISRAVTLLDKRIRYASISLSEGKPSIFERYGSTILSWSAGVVGSILAGVLLAYLQGWLGLK